MPSTVNISVLFRSHYGTINCLWWKEGEEERDCFLPALLALLPWHVFGPFFFHRPPPSMCGDRQQQQVNWFQLDVVVVVVGEVEV